MEKDQKDFLGQVTEGIKDGIRENLERANESLQPFNQQLKQGENFTKQGAQAAEKIATDTGIKDVAEIVTTVDSAYGAVKGVATAVKGVQILKEGIQAAKSGALKEAGVDIEAAIDRSMVKPGTGVSNEYATTYRLKQGNFGERMATDALAQDGHDIMYAKPDIKGTNQGGIDIVTMKDGVLYAVDNKAFTTGKNVSSVSALDKNFEQNIAAIRSEFAGHAADPANSELARQKFTQAVEAIDKGNVQKMVTTAAFAEDGKMSVGITSKLENKDFTFHDVTKPPAAGASNELKLVPPEVGRGAVERLHAVEKTQAGLDPLSPRLNTLDTMGPRRGF